jgi:hypothetical protein
VTAKKRKVLDLALGILAELPTTIRALSADGGVVPVQVVTSDEDGISAHIPTDQARPGAELRVRIRDDEGSGHDILMDVRDSFFAAENVELARLEIRAVRRIDGDRTEPRAQVSDLALVHIESGASIRSGAEFDVRLSDLSGDGLAFVTTEPIREGDRMSVMTMVDGSFLRLTAAALHVTPAHYGRHRVGAEVLDATEADRERLATLARNTPAAGSRTQRFETRAA